MGTTTSTNSAVENLLTPEDRVILDSVPHYLAAGLALQSWWVEADRNNSYAESFPLIRSFNMPERAFGFFDQLRFEGKNLAVMGNVQEMFYDRPRTRSATPAASEAEWMRLQIREFILHYFMRISSFREPEAVGSRGSSPPPDFLSDFSWCAKEHIERVGFGFTQLYYKLAGTGEIGKFPTEQASAVVDVRELGSKYEWIVVKVKIFDFNVKVGIGEKGPAVSYALDEESLLVLTRDFITDKDNPAAGVLGEYGIGYAFIKNPTKGVVDIAYGPGEFDAAVELINFRVDNKGCAKVRMVFVANRPDKIVDVSLDPVDWGFRVADVLSFGTASNLLKQIKTSVDQFPSPLKGASFDPVYGFISLANGVSAGEAARQLCISRTQLDVDFLVQHFQQHYTTIVGSLLVWNLVPNWLDTQTIPRWVIEGKSS